MWPISWTSSTAQWFQVPPVSMATGYKMCVLVSRTWRFCWPLPGSLLHLPLWQCRQCVIVHKCLGRWHPRPLACLCTMGSRGRFEGNAWKFRSHSWKADGTFGNGVSTVNVVKNALWTSLPTISRPNAIDCRILRIQSQKIVRGWYPGPRRSILGVWTQTPSSAWLASVPTVPVLRNDHCWDQCAAVSNFAESDYPEYLCPFHSSSQKIIHHYYFLYPR